jgi:hypothetical protein
MCGYCIVTANSPGKEDMLVEINACFGMGVRNGNYLTHSW